MSDCVVILVNGERREVVPGTTVLELLRQLHLDSGLVAIERNREILPRARWMDSQIEPDDRFEIVQFVGGG